MKKLQSKMDEMKDPLDQKLLNMASECEGMGRQTKRFVMLYRKCLTDLKEEVEAKQVFL